MITEYIISGSHLNVESMLNGASKSKVWLILTILHLWYRQEWGVPARVCMLDVLVVMVISRLEFLWCLECRRELDLVSGITLELLARAKLWVTQTQESSCAAVADLRRKAGQLEDDIARASEESLQLYTKSTMLANKMLGAEVKLKTYAEGRQKAAAVLAVQRMQEHGLASMWSTWTKTCKEARRITVAEERLLALVMVCGLASAWDSWRDALRAARRERRAAVFAVAKSKWRSRALLQWWRSASGSMAWAVQIMTTRAALAESKALSKCQKILAVFRTWRELRGARSESSSVSANLSKFVSYWKVSITCRSFSLLVQGTAQWRVKLQTIAVRNCSKSWIHFLQ